MPSPTLGTRKSLPLPDMSRALRTAKLLSVLIFCLVNPLAGWAYLHHAQSRNDREVATVADTLKTQRIRLLPLTGCPDVHSRHWFALMANSLAESQGVEVCLVSNLATDSESYPSPDYVLEGNYYCSGDELQIHVRLVGNERREVLWSETFVGNDGSIEEWCERARVGILSALSLK